MSLLSEAKERQIIAKRRCDSINEELKIATREKIAADAEITYIRKLLNKTDDQLFKMIETFTNERIFSNDKTSYDEKIIMCQRILEERNSD